MDRVFIVEVMGRDALYCLGSEQPRAQTDDPVELQKKLLTVAPVKHIQRVQEIRKVVTLCAASINGRRRGVFSRTA